MYQRLALSWGSFHLTAMLDYRVDDITHTGVSCSQHVAWLGSIPYNISRQYPRAMVTEFAFLQPRLSAPVVLGCEMRVSEF